MLQDRIQKLEEQVAAFRVTRGTIKKNIATQKRRRDAKSEAVRVEATELMERAQRDLEDVERKLARATLELELERAVRTSSAIFDAIKAEEAATLDLGVGSLESDRVVAARFLDLENVRAMQNFLKGRAGDLVETLRVFVAAHFKAYTQSDDPEKRYPAWFADASLFIAVLQDNPLYALTVDQLIALVGLQQAIPLFQVNYGAVEKLARDGVLTDTSGALITSDRLADLRQRKERTPSLVLKPRGDQPIEEILDLIDPRFAERGVGIDALGLDGATDGALRTAGYTLVEQVRASFDTLQSIRGIGPKRAAKILDALVARAA